VAGAIVSSAIKVRPTITKYEVTWVSDASGDVSGSTFVMQSGTIIQVEFIPGPGALAPNDLYDVDVQDEHGVSILDDGAGTTVGSNLSSTAASHKVPMVGLPGVSVVRRWHQGGPTEMQVSGAGDTNAGTVALYVMEGVI